MPGINLYKRYIRRWWFLISQQDPLTNGCEAYDSLSLVHIHIKT